jgi:oxaloacetate decarboxylase beta subunit
MLEILKEFFAASGIMALDGKALIMIGLSLFFLYLAIYKKYEPYLLIPIAFGMLLVNLPKNGLMETGGLLKLLYMGIEYGIYPSLIFLGVGASTDFGTLIANPKSMLLGAAAQLGIFFAFLGAILLGYTALEAASIGIIGGADGPTAIYLTSQLADHMLGPIALAAYSYMALVPAIQPPIIKLLTTKEERQSKMKQLRPVSRLEKLLFPIVVTVKVILLVPSAAPLIGMLMFGNLMRESGVVERLTKGAQNELTNIVTILLGLAIGSTMVAQSFLNVRTLMIMAMGMVAFALDTAAGLVLGKIMCRVSGKRINPLIGASGISAFPMSARVVQKVANEEDPTNFILMQAMGSNTAGQIASVMAGGVILALLGA